MLDREEFIACCIVVFAGEGESIQFSQIVIAIYQRDGTIYIKMRQ